MKLFRDQIIHELKFITSKSSGKGGQHVNKTESRVSLFFDLNESLFFNKEQKIILFINLQNRINNEFKIQVDVEETRSQIKNKEIAIKRFIEIIENGLKTRKKRKPSKPNKRAIQKRLKEKKQKSEKKQSRRFNF